MGRRSARARAGQARATHAFVGVDQLELLTQQRPGAISTGDLVEISGGRIGVARDVRGRSLDVEILPGFTRASVDKAVGSFRAFSGHEPGGLVTLPAPRPIKTAWLLGELEVVGYRAMRDGRLDSYVHEFKKRARPTLVVTTDGQQLAILGGDYQVTDRGITDR